MAQLGIWFAYVASVGIFFASFDSSPHFTEAGCVSGASTSSICMGSAENELIYPDRCACPYLPELGGFLVDCKEKNLKKIPSDLPENTVQLNLENNKISSLTRVDFSRCFKLRKLQLNRNELHSIDALAFADTYQLSELHLNNNALNLNGSNLGYLDYLKNLTALSVAGNPYVGDTVFEKLPHLHRLSLNRTKTIWFGEVFLNLTMLKQVSVHGDFTKIENNSFENLRNAAVEVLKFRSSDTLSEIEPGAFENIPHLDKLDLSFNRGIGFDTVSLSWYGLRHKNMSSLELTDICSISRAFNDIKKSFYKYIGDACITSLSLSRNDISSIEYGLSEAFPCLENLNLSYNRLSNISYLLKDMAGMINLRHADISYTNKRFPVYDRNSLHQPQNLDAEMVGETLPNSQLRKTPSIQKLRNCSFRKWVPCNIAFFHKSEYLFDSSAKFTLQHISDITPYGPWCIIIPRRLESINLTASLNYIIQKFPQTLLLGRNYNFREFIFRKNEVKEFFGPVVLASVSNSTPITVDIGDNGAFCISPDIFNISIQTGANISRLILDDNHLGEQLYFDEDGEVFKNYKDLIELNLARNSIKGLPVNIFRNLSKLRVLILKSNSLRYIKFTFSHMRNLEYLDLSHNLLTELPIDVYLNLTPAFTTSNLTLRITGNPIQCSCQTLPFLIWMNANRKHLENIEDIYCILNNNQSYFKNLETVIIPQLTIDCQSNILLIVTALLLATVIVAVITSVCLYRHRWDIKYWILNFRRSKLNYQRLINRTTGYRYDAFVSYDSRDRSWVTQDLIPNLEVRKTEAANAIEPRQQIFALCIHERDFVAGESIQEEIVTNIRSSRKVLLILTRNFLERRWCKFELEMSQVESFERGWNIIIPIMLEELSMEEIPGALQMLIRKRTYLEWKNSLPDKNDFWIRLRSILAEVDHEPCPCECQGASNVPGGISAERNIKNDDNTQSSDTGSCVIS